MPEATPMLEVRGLTGGYGASQVLFGLDLEIAAGEVVGLLGRNGMGKTTTVRAIMGLTPPSAGEVRFEGRPLHGLPPHAIARAGLGLVPEGRQIFPNLTVREQLLATARPRIANGGITNRSIANGGIANGGIANGDSAEGDGRDDIPGAAVWNEERVLELFPALAARCDHWGNQLSGGEQQMLAIGRALMTNPRLLILDEATEGLAPLLRAEIWRCLALLRAERQSILVIDKNLDALLGLADRNYILAKGRIVWSGTSAALAADEAAKTEHLGV